MSLPEFPTPDPCLTREQAINMILASIAMEEIALSHILEAESEKIRYVLECLEHHDRNSHIEKILEVNKSVSELVDAISDTQLILKKKMEKALDALPKMCPQPCPPHPPCPPPEHEKDCCCVVSIPRKRCSVFEADSCLWCKDSALPLRKRPSSCTCIELWPLGNTKILLPSCSRFVVSFRFELTQLQPCSEPVSIELELSRSSHTLQTERFYATDGGRISLSGSVIVETPCNYPQARLVFNLLSPSSMQVENGRINIAEI